MAMAFICPLLLYLPFPGRARNPMPLAPAAINSSRVASVRAAEYVRRRLPAPKSAAQMSRKNIRTGSAVIINDPIAPKSIRHAR